MQNKPSPKSWADVQLVITSISVALTLGFWNLFASPEERPLGGGGAEADLQAQPAGSIVTRLPLQVGQVVILNGAAPQVQSQPQAATSRSRKNKGGGGAVTTTGSSR